MSKTFFSAAFFGRKISIWVNGTHFLELDTAIQVRCTCERVFFVSKADLCKPITCWNCGNGDYAVSVKNNGITVKNIRKRNLLYSLLSFLGGRKWTT